MYLTSFCNSLLKRGKLSLPDFQHKPLQCSNKKKQQTNKQTNKPAT